jgi:hypothetical protein
MKMATAMLCSIRHSRAGGNLGLFSRELAWIPAFAGMTEKGPRWALRSLSPQCYFEEGTKDAKVWKINVPNFTPSW